MRKVFGHMVFSVKECQSSYFSGNAKFSSSTKEVEVLKLDDLITSVEKFSKPSNNVIFNQSHKKSIEIVFASSRLDGLIQYKQLCQAFALLDIPEGKPNDTDFYKYSILDLKSIRILNRLNNHLKINKISITDMTIELSQKTKTKKHNIET